MAHDRRRWTPRDVVARLVLAAENDRAEELCAVGRRLLARATELEGHPADGQELSDELAVVRGWAAGFDRNSYRVAQTEHGLLIEQVPDPDAAARLAAMNTDLVRGQEATRIHMRYPERFDHLADHRPVAREELLTDLAAARDLAEDPPATGPLGAYDAPAAVAASALEARFVDGVAVPDDDVGWAARLLVELMNQFADQGAAVDDYAVFGRGADHAAARGLPLLMLPAAGALRDQLTADGKTTEAITRATTWIVESASNETRLFLARAFDPVWSTPCSTSGATCHHAEALSIVEDTARNSILGRWDQAQQRRTRARITGPVTPRLMVAGQKDIYVPQLNPAIRGTSAAAVSTACCSTNAAALLAAGLAAHRRGMRASEHGHDHSATDALVAARALLDLAAAGDPTLLFEHLDGYADHPRLLWEFLRALAAAGEEAPTRAKAAGETWPAVLDRIVELATAGAFSNGDRDYREDALAAAIPAPSYDSGYLHREYHCEPIQWADPEALAPHIERWLPVAAGHPDGVDALAHLLHRLPAERQASLGLPWMEQLVMADPPKVAGRSYLLPEWLERVRPHSANPALGRAWHRIVDALTVAGDDRVAALAD